MQLNTMSHLPHEPEFEQAYGGKQSNPQYLNQQDRF